jgi:hypothetical protein
VVDVKDVKPQAPFGRQAQQQVQERHRVGASRNGD